MKTRVFSAIIAVALLIGVTYFWKTAGLYAICITASLGIILEYARLSLKLPFVRLASEHFHYLRWVVALFSSLIFFITAFGESTLILAALSLFTVLFLTMTLFAVRTHDDLLSALHLQSLGLLGIFYGGLFPGLATRLLSLDESGMWLFALLAIVLTGDTMAYLAGITFGRRKLLEAVSPKKTFEGSIGGLAGSAFAGAIFGIFFLSAAPLIVVITVALVTGAFAQAGDLFESLLKRVAQLKDSGGIMPGHGGVLDRLDGVLFSAPVFYILARTFLVS